MKHLPKNFSIAIEKQDLGKAIEKTRAGRISDVDYARHCVIAQAIKRQLGVQVSIQSGGEVYYRRQWWFDGEEASRIVGLFDKRDNDNNIISQNAIEDMLPLVLNYSKEGE